MIATLYAVNIETFPIAKASLNFNIAIPGSTVSRGFM